MIFLFQLVIQGIFILLAYGWPLFLGIIIYIVFSQAIDPDPDPLAMSNKGCVLFYAVPLAVILIYIFIIPRLYSFDQICFLCNSTIYYRGKPLN